MKKDNASDKGKTPSNSVENVGYRNPPKHSQFKKGQSGNPKGRPKGAKNKLGGNLKKLGDMVMKAANREITVNDGGRQVSMSMADAMLKSLSLKAAKGDHASAKLFLYLIKDAEKDHTDDVMTAIKNLLAYKRYHSEHLRSCKTEGISYDIPIPHPDHIHIDYENMEINIDGPIDQKEFQEYKALILRMVGMEVELSIPHDLESDVDREMTRHYLSKMKQNIPDTDPLWEEFALEFRKRWIDFYYFYGPNPRNEEARFSSPYEEIQEPANLPKKVASRAAVAEYFKGLEGFKKYMREHLRQRMGDEWDKRHNKHSHTRRDISRDKIRYEYHTRILDLDRYEYTEDQKHILRHCPEVADQHFAWG